MLEMLNPSALDVARFAASTLQFRLAFAAKRQSLPWADAAAKQLKRAKAARFLSDKFCTPPESTRRLPDLARIQHDAQKFFGWDAQLWREHEPEISAVIEHAHTYDLEYLSVAMGKEAKKTQRVRSYRWSAIGRKRGTMLLCHGWEGYAFNFAMLIAHARRAGFEVHSFDHLAHGASSGDKGGMPIAVETLQVVAKAIGKLDVVVGHSLGGGAVAWAMANRALVTQRAVLLAPFFDTYYLTKLWGKAHLLDADAVSLLQQGLETDSAMTFDEFWPPALATGITQPTLILHDPKDRMTRYKDSAALAKLSARVELQAVDKVGHVGLLADAPTMQRVVQFASGK